MTGETLYRPVGLKELKLIADADWRVFPPRLGWQPIFYPVLNEAYAIQIARDWNTQDPASGYAGFVTRFEVDADYLSRFEIRTVGAAHHREIWVPADELPRFNEHISGPIRVVAAFYGTQFTGDKPFPEH